jgi:glycosylphosphatidylinositol transamidase
VPSVILEVVPRDLFSPLAIVLGIHALGLVPFWILNQVPEEVRKCHSILVKPY